MPLVASPIPNLTGGMTQQPASMRLNTMCQFMENAWPSVVSGLQKRPPTRHVADLGVSLGAGCTGHLIERDPNYRYIVVAENGNLRVVDLNTGILQVVDFPNGTGYLTAASPTDAFRFVTIGDDTFILNRNFVTQMYAQVEVSSTLPVPGQLRYDPNTMATAYVTQAAYNTYYSIYINSVLQAQYLTPTGVSGSAACPDTGQIAAGLRTQLNSNGFTTILDGSSITITNMDPSWTLATQGGSGDKACRGFVRDVQQFSDLPPVMFNGRIVRVAADLATANDDYFVVFEKGKWIETLDWNAGLEFYQSSMPHVLVNNGGGSWTFKEHTWKGRQVGDADSSAVPSFVGNTINDIFTYTNRFGILSDENVVLSESGNYENFFRTTTAQLLDSDPIDIAVLHNNVDILYHAVPYNRDLLLCSETDQFRLTYQNFIGQKTTSVQYSTSFNMSKRVKPTNVANSVYFVDDRPDYLFAKMFEFFPKDNATTDDADDVTAPIPELIATGVDFMCSSNRSKVCVAHTTADPTSLYAYKFFWSDSKKIQNAWGKWTFKDCTKIHWADFAGTYLYLLVERNGSTQLERMRTDEDVWDTDINFEVMLDRRYTVPSGAMAYNNIANYTVIGLPYAVSIPVEVVLQNLSLGITGIRAQVSMITPRYLTIPGDMTSYNITVGIPYTKTYEFSPFYMKQRIPYVGGFQLVQDGRLQIRYLTLEYHDTSYFDVTITQPGRDPFVSKFSGAFLSSSGSVLGRQPTATGKFRVPVMAENYKVKIVLTNDTPFPSALGSAEWSGIYSPKAATRIS